MAVHGLGERLRMCEADGRPTASAGAISRAVMPSRLWHCSTARRPAKSSESCRRCAGGSPLARGVGSLWQPLSGGAYERPGWGADPKPVLPFRIAVELVLPLNPFRIQHYFPKKLQAIEHNKFQPLIYHPLPAIGCKCIAVS